MNKTGSDDFIALVDVDGIDAFAAHRVKLGQDRLLDNAFFGGEQIEAGSSKLFTRSTVWCDFLARLDVFEKVDEGFALRAASGIRDLPNFEPITTA